MHRLGYASGGQRIIGKITSVFGSIFSVFGRLGRKLWLLMPKKMRYFLQKGREVGKVREYYYIKYTISALKVIAWVVLVLGFVGSLIWGITTGGIQGGLFIVVGIIGSFLAWLFLLVAMELLKLCMDVRENTRNTAGGVRAAPH